MNQNLVVSGLIAFALASVLLRIFARIAHRIGLVDHPRRHKAHDCPTPLVGGIAMFVAFTFAVLNLDVSLAPYRLLFAGALILVVVGLLDDLRELSVLHRFGAQISAGLLMAAGAGVELHDMGHLLSPDEVLSLGMLALPVTVFSTVGVINAVNMTDGLDGLAASLVLVAVGALILIASIGGEVQPMGVLLLFAAVVLAFLLVNLQLSGRALAFMGDAGSLFLGFVLAWFLIGLSQGEGRLLAPVTALWIFALPLVDTVSVMGRRMLLGRSPFLADREHLHHMLQAAGFTQKQTLAVILTLSLAAAGLGLAGHFLGVPEHWMFLGFLALFGLHFRVMMRSWATKRFLNRPLMDPHGSGG